MNWKGFLCLVVLAPALTVLAGTGCTKDEDSAADSGVDDTYVMMRARPPDAGWRVRLPRE